MGESEGKSMLYLEARCLSLVRAAGSQGVQNGSISCIALALVGAGRHARGAGRERARRVARPRGRLRQRRDREPLGDPQDGEADGPVPAGHRLRHVGLLVDAALRQHVRRRQLRLARPRRVADAAARLAGRRRHRAARRGRARSPCATRAARAVQAVFDELGFPPITDEEVRLAATCLDSRDLPDRDRAADVARGRPRARGGDQRARRRARARPPRLRRRRATRSSACSASGSRRTTSRRRRSSTPTARSSRRSTTRTATPGRAPATGSRASAGSGCSSCRTRSTHGCSVRRSPSAPSSRRRATPSRASAADEVVIAVGPAFGDALGGDDQRPRARRRARGAARRRARRGGVAAARAGPALRGRRVHRPRRRAALRLRDRGRPPVEGHGADPPRRPRSRSTTSSSSAWRRR